MGLFDFFKKKESTPQEQQALETGLEKTKDSFFSKITKVVAGKSSVDDDVLDDLEEVLVTSDVGVSTTLKTLVPPNSTASCAMRFSNYWPRTIATISRILNMARTNPM